MMLAGRTVGFHQFPPVWLGCQKAPQKPHPDGFAAACPAGIRGWIPQLVRMASILCQALGIRPGQPSRAMISAVVPVSPSLGKMVSMLCRWMASERSDIASVASVML
jgi:hypothetical protein